MKLLLLVLAIPACFQVPREPEAESVTCVCFRPVRCPASEPVGDVCALVVRCGAGPCE